MDEQQVRELVREALARHLGRDGSPSRPSPQDDAFEGRDGSLGAEAVAKATPSRSSPPSSATWKAHLSHGRFVFLAPAEPNAPCIVEPQVRCHHCGFCQSYGH